MVAEAAALGAGPAQRASRRRLSAATQEERSMSRPSGRRASTWVTSGSAPRARRIEIEIEHAGRAEELELARRALADVEIGRAEQGDERAGILPDHAFEAGGV